MTSERDSLYLVRDPQAGDFDIIVERQWRVYESEYGWNSDFRDILVDIIQKYQAEFDQSLDRCWIAEKEGQVVGSIFVVKHDQTTAKLRMLYVDSSARGLGIGKRLIEETINFARQSGYKRMVLWTMSVLTTARGLYQRAGFNLVEEEKVQSFGKDLVSQTWSLDL
ncbi:hypothetical protein CYY_004850 [Polysphondylium violaceum]|uniref:N-acetyltransferase domain-containing protein n=1 Tax=Polysphondylium violaceum TaxID=133409 RepID=A0A8J4PXG5_9MYCE|nr:hypothetical protein CYY_004850 [Polysphondylium violaceum]